MRIELESQIASLDVEYKNITTIISKQGEEWHKEIDRVINKMTNEMNEIKVKHQDILKQHLKEIKQIEYSIKENLDTLKDIQQESNVVSLVMEYRSRNSEFSNITPIVHISFPSFCPKSMDKREVEKLIGSIKPLTFTTNEKGYALRKQTMGSSRNMLDTPEVINTFNTKYKGLKSVFVYREEKIWTCANNTEIKCFNFKGNANNTVKSKQVPCDIAVISEGCLLYSDSILQTINKVVDGQIEKLIKFRGWIPTNLHVTFSGDILVVMSDVALRRNKVVRYSSSFETQTIQFGEDGKPLYSGDYKVKFITENKNLDICVADRATCAVVVVNQAGKLRFRYTGHKLKEKPFIPRGITTNSQSQILTADRGNHCIHILDQDGQFLRNIDNIKFDDPNGLCVDTFDNLYVAEYNTGDVKVIRYLK